ncbi:ABC transporter permease subunit [Oricola sp.]|uniref:ABC transporter permease n=1 Tax=Oricola sp. TaxID=1979950 RepID=UPI0025E92D25|nr:ABC transporter permease subunit [Oricola sp.]MCI5077950.1 ABC transporter permease subunit [Oricola sp.]
MRALRILASPTLAAVLFPFALGLVLEGAVRAGLISKFAIPLPSSILAAIPQLATRNDLAGRFLSTASLAVVSGVLICVLGVLIGVLLYRLPRLGAAAEPLVAGFAAAPLILAYPIFLVFFGRNPSALIAFATVGGLAPVVLKTTEGLKTVRPVFRKVGQTLKLTPRQAFFKIELPAALPTIVTGIRLGFVFGLIHLIAFEFLLNYGGLGGLVAEFSELYNPPATFAAILFVMMLCALVIFVTERLERWIR